MNKQMLEQIHPQMLQNFQVLKKIGQGAYGQVWKVKDKKTSSYYALKKIYDAFRNSTDAQRAYREIRYLQKLNHPNIIKLYSFFKPKDTRDIYIALQFMEADLATAIKNNLLKDMHKHYIFYQIAHAVHYLHSAQLIHRDLKPSNILVNEQCDIKLCDFGLIRSLVSADPHKRRILTQNIATRWYRAPQILLCSNQYGKQIDIWSLGCVLAEIFLGKPIFQGTSAISQLQRIFQITGKPNREQLGFIKSQASKSIVESMSVTKKYSIKQLFPNHSIDLTDLLQKIFQIDPKKRVKIEQIIRHPLVGKFRGQLLLGQQCPIKIMYESQPLCVQDYKLLLDHQIQEKACGKISQMSTFYDSTITHSLNNQSRQAYLGINYPLGKFKRFSPQKPNIINHKQIQIPIYHFNKLNKQESQNYIKSFEMKSNEPNKLRITSHISNINPQNKPHKTFKTPQANINKMNGYLQKRIYSPIKCRSNERLLSKIVDFDQKRVIETKQQHKKNGNVPKFIREGKKKFKSKEPLQYEKRQTVCFLQSYKPYYNQVSKTIFSPRYCSKNLISPLNSFK